jgi:predicted outer membrane repeat protein
MRAVTGIVALGIGLMLPGVARADAVVTLCSEDTQGGAGTNLAAALAVGGRITFACGSGAVLLVNSFYRIDQWTEIAGEGKVTLDFRGPTAGFYGDTTEYSQHVPASGSLVLSGLTLTNANATATDLGYPSIVSGYLNLTVQSSTFISSHFPVGLVGQSVLVSDSTFSGGDGSALTVAYAPGCQLEIRRSQFISNSGELGSALRTYCDATIDRSTFSSNSATSSGGAIYLGHAYYGNALLAPEGASQTVSIRTTTFEANSAQAGGGAIAVQAGPVARSLSIRFSRFVKNTASSGGAIELGVPASLPGPPGVSDIVLDVFGGSLVNNSAQVAGGAVDVAAAAAVRATRAIVADNQAQQTGGGMHFGQALSGVASVLGNSLFVRNEAPTGAALSAADVTIVSSTLADNAGGAALGYREGAGKIVLQGSLVVNNAGGNCDSKLSVQGLVDGGENIQYPGQACGPSIQSVNPRLDNMYLPVWNSPAMRAGDALACASPPVNGVDLFGQLRQAPCAIGALEGDLRRPADVGGINFKPPPNPGSIGSGEPGCGCNTTGNGNPASRFVLTTIMLMIARRTLRRGLQRRETVASTRASRFRSIAK